MHIYGAIKSVSYDIQFSWINLLHYAEKAVDSLEEFQNTEA